MDRIDGGDLACGELLLLVARRTRSAPHGTIIEIVTTDPAAGIDIPAWCHLTGHSYRGPTPGATTGHHLVELRASARPVDPANAWRLATPSAH